MHFIYIITNIINNKIYIGQTNNPQLRWAQHKSNAKYNRGQQVITRAMSKHGTSNFIFEVIASCILQEDTDKSEAEIIIQYDSRNPNKGYNIDAGGNTTPRTPEILKKISDGLKKYYSVNHNHMKGKNLPEEWKINISKASLGKAGANLGKKFNDDWRLRIARSQVGKERKNRRRFTESIENEICSLYLEENRSTYYLGKQFSCTRALILDILQRNNVQKRKTQYKGRRGNIFSSEQESEICKLYLSGKFSIADIAKNFNRGKTTIRAILIRHNL